MPQASSRWSFLWGWGTLPEVRDDETASLSTADDATSLASVSSVDGALSDDGNPQRPATAADRPCKATLLCFQLR